MNYLFTSFSFILNLVVRKWRNDFCAYLVLKPILFLNKICCRKNASRIPLNHPQNVMLDQNSGDDWVDLASDEGLTSLRDTEDIMMAGSSSPSQEEYTYDEVDHGGHRRRIHANNGGRPEQQAMCSQGECAL